MAGPIYTQPLGAPDNSNSNWMPGPDLDILTGIQDGGDDSGYWGPPDSGGGSPYPGDTPAGGSGGFSLADLTKWWNGGKGLLDLAPGSDGKSIAAGLMIPAWMAAYQSWQDADKYGDTAKEAMKYGDPFGQDNRDAYQKMLMETYTNPEKWLNDPGHQAKLNFGMDAVARNNASKGYLGSGNMETDLTTFATNLNNQFLSDERKSLMPLTGYQFDPAQAGKFLMEGNNQSIQAKNAALQALMYPFAMNMTENHITNQNSNPSTNNGGGNNGPGLNNKPIDWSKYTSSPEAIQKEIMKITGGMGGSAASIWNAILGGQYQDISPSTRMFIEDMANDPNNTGADLRGFFPETGSGGNLVDYAPPGMGGFGGHGGYDNVMGGENTNPTYGLDAPNDPTPSVTSPAFFNFVPSGNDSFFDSLGNYLGFDP